MTRLKIAFMAMMTTIVLSLGSAQAISPFTEIGNLEMEVLNAINDVISSLNVEILRIDSLVSTQAFEQSEQDGIQTNMTAVQAQIGAYAPIMEYNTLVDSNDPLCEPDQTVTQVSDGWCPTGTFAEFEITNPLVDAESLIVINLVGDGRGCGVVDVVAGTFKIVCSTNVLDGVQLNYLFVQ